MLLHITDLTTWQTALSAGHYQCPSLEIEGFIHCSTLAQILEPANSFYRGQQNLLLLAIDSQKVRSPVIYEDCYETGEKFPHIYGLLNLDAVIQVVNFPPLSDGTFMIPADLRTE